MNERAARLRKEGRDIIPLNLCEPDFHTAENIKAAGRTAIEQNFTKYTASDGCAELKVAITEKLRRENLFPMLHEIRCPVLLAWAKDDFVLPLKLNEKSFEQFPDHHLEEFEGGHAAFLEDSVRFEESLRTFVGSLGSRSAGSG
jgi:pimeloyl-ACP methyl ester carboxylesterase